MIEPGAPLELDVIEPGISVNRDGCRILSHISAFVATEGVPSVLQFTFRERQGNPLDLTSPIAGDLAGGDSMVSLTLDTPPDDTVLLAIREATLHMNQGIPLLVAGTFIDRSSGVVQAGLPAPIYSQSGLYTLSWGYSRDGKIRVARDALLSVERSLFGFTAPGAFPHGTGAPTIAELRNQLIDSDRADNLLLNDVEFSDEQILFALLRPLQDFESAPPPISQHFDTRNFPWRNEWLDAAAGYLLRSAADNYRRNRLAIVGGGKQLDVFNREPEYMKAAQMRIQEWKSFVVGKKVQLNAAACFGSFGVGGYGGRW